MQNTYVSLIVGKDPATSIQGRNNDYSRSIAHHVGIYGASPGCAVYTNGKIGTVTTATNSPYNTNKANGLYIGVASDAASSWFLGSIYYFALYPFALTPTQILCERNFALQNLNKVG
jgi:hypothetical protein